MEDLVVTKRITIPARDLHWTAVRASGPGGQNVNKVATKVVLRFDLEGTAALSPAVKARIVAREGGRLDADGHLVITVQVTRSQSQNLEQARQALAAIIRPALVPAKRRRPTKPGRGAVERRLSSKRRTADTKARRGRVDRDGD